MLLTRQWATSGLPDGDEQGLQQFITDSPWDDMAVPRPLARRMSREIAPDGWIVDDTGLPKDGRYVNSAVPACHKNTVVSWEYIVVP